MWPNSKVMYQGIKDLNMLESHSYLVSNVNTGESYGEPGGFKAVIKPQV